MSGVCDGFSGDWFIGLSNHINEAAQEDEQGIYGRSLRYQRSIRHLHHCHHKYVHQNHRDYLCNHHEL